MSNLSKIIGKEATHPHLRKVAIESQVPKSRTMVNVVATDRGPGWDPRTQSYKGIKVPGGWYRGQNYQFGFKDVVHVNELVDIKEANQD